MIFCYGEGRNWQGEPDYAPHVTTCWKCDGRIYYRRDGGFPVLEDDAVRIVCPYCGYNHRVSRRYDG